MSKFDFLKKIGLFSALALTISGCGKFDPSVNEPVCIYGPPEMLEEPVEQEPEGSEILISPSVTDEDSDIDEEEIGEPFDPSVNEPVCIYGPPEMFGDSE